MEDLTPTQLAARLEQLTELSVALGDGQDTGVLLERILLAAKHLTHADGGTLYRPDASRSKLLFHITVNDTLCLHLGGSSGAAIDIAPVPLLDAAGAPKLDSVAAYAANLGRAVNIDDVYQAGAFNFSGMRQFDQRFGYRTRSILTVPMRDHEGQLLGVLQLVNAGNADGVFSPTDQRFIEALAAQAAVALTKQQLVAQLEQLLEALVNLINIGIDEKSPYTGRHCQLVPVLTMMLADAAHAADSGPLAAFRLSEGERKQLWLAGLLHDCGKITTPVHVVDKATKLQTIYDRIGLIDTRFEVLLRDAELRSLRARLDGGDGPALQAELAAELDALRAEREFLRQANIGGEGMAPEAQQRVRQIARRRWRGPDGREQPLLSEEEVANLTIRFGTLTEDERKVINNHIVVTVRMLEALPWPRHLQQVPEYAGGHHERMDGKGYPRGLLREQMSVPARVMAIADIFEALTARDRPYKKGKMLSESLEILGKFSLNGHIDPDLFDIFIRRKVYLEFARQYMDPRQVDAVDEARIPGVSAVMRRLLQRYGARWLLGLLLTALAVLQLVQLLPSETLARMDSFFAGMRMRLEAPELDPRIVIVDIDERSLAEVGRFPWSRDKVARLVEQLTGTYQVAAVGFDISFPEPDTSSGYAVLEQLAQGELRQVPGLERALAGLRPQLDYDGRLAAAMRGRPVVLGYSLSGSQRKGVLPAPAFTVESLHGRTLDAYAAQGYEANIAPLQAAAAGAGIFTALVDSDGLVRSSPLLQRIGDGYYPTLALATVSAALGGRAIAPLWPGAADTLSAAERASGGLDAIVLFHREGQLRIPVGEALANTVQFRGRGGPAGGAFPYVAAADVLAGRARPALLAGAIVLVGTSAPGLNDLRATPVNPEYPGVEIHANLVKSILDDSFKQRPDVATQFEVLQALVLGCVLALALPVLAPAWGILLSLAALAGTVALNFLLYRRYDAVLNLATLLLLGMALFVLNLAWGYFFEVRRGRALVSRFGEYVAPELVAEMAENPAQYSMEGESRELSVMFVDVRGFTTIAEGLPPRELREYINRYLTAMSEEIRDRHRGTLDKYIGDAVMAFWGAPVACADHAARAVATALAMQASAARLSTEFEQRGWPPLRIGIGINSGPMHVGDMGSRIRRAYTVMGDAVNLASRLEGITKVYGAGIVAGAATRAAAPGFAWRELDLVRVKGKLEPVAIFEPLGPEDGLDAAASAELRRWHEVLALVRAQQWQAAHAALAPLAAAAPQNTLYALYLQRIAHYRQQPPGAGWDGVTSFDSK